MLNGIMLNGIVLNTTMLNLVILNIVILIIIILNIVGLSCLLSLFLLTHRKFQPEKFNEIWGRGRGGGERFVYICPLQVRQ
jgi:hypothetical protein